MSKTKSKSSKPTAPAGLTGEAKAEWDRVCKELDQVGRLHKVDRAVLTVYVRCWTIFRDAAQHVASNGMTMTYSNGMMALTPQYKAMKEMSSRLQSLLETLGLTPGARDAAPKGESEPEDLVF